MSDDKPVFRPHISVRPVASAAADTEDADTDWGSVPPPPPPPNVTSGAPEAEEPTHQRPRNTPPMPPPESVPTHALPAADLPPASGPRSNPPSANNMRPRVQSSVGDVVVADPGAIGPGERVPAEAPRETAAPAPPPVDAGQPASVPHVRISESEMVRRPTIDGMWAPTPPAAAPTPAPAPAAPAPQALAPGAPAHPPPAAGRLPQPPTPTLGKALSMRVRVAGTPVRLWPFLAVPLLTMATITVMALVFAAGRQATRATDVPTTTEAPTPTDGAPTARVRAVELSTKPREERTSAETIAIARFESDQKRRELRELGQRMIDDPELAKDPKSLLTLKAAVYDRDSWLVALETMAALPGPLGPDLLYRSWTATRARTDATKLAEELVYSTDVRSKASEALSIALDLRAAETCEARKALLPRATEHADHRSLGELAKLLQKRGCGPKKLDDCNACLREGSALDDAIAATKKRPPPTN